MTTSRRDRTGTGAMRSAWAVVALLVVTSISPRADAQIDDVRVVMITNDESPDVGETFQIQIEARVSGNQIAGTLLPPAFGNLRVVGTTGEMHTQSMHQVFGSNPQIESRTVIGFMLVADRPGVYTIAGANYRYGRRTATSDPIVIKVGGSDTAIAPPQATTAAGDAYEFDRDVFLRATVDHAEPYLGQQVTYTLYLYTRIDGEPSLTRRPSTDGFWMQGLLPPQRQMNPDFQSVRGNHYRVYVIERLALFPERTGPLEIGGAELEMDLGGIVGRMMGRNESLHRSCPPLRVTVRPLPAGAPRGTIVGTASITSEMDRTRLTTGEAATLTVTLVAEGSIRDTTVTLPPIDGLRIEPPAIEDAIDSPRDLVGGTRRIRYQLVPLRPGTFEIPALAITTFDVESGIATPQRTSPIAIVATGAVIDDSPVATAEDEPEDDRADDDAMAFGPARRHAAMLRRTLPVHARPFYLPLLVAPLVGLAVLLSGGRAREALSRRRAESGGRRGRSRKPLAEANRAYSLGDAGAFYASIAGALHVALERKTGARSHGMTHPEIRAFLIAGRLEAELVDRVIDELDSADFARFSATAASKDEMGRALERTRALLDRVDRSTYVAPSTEDEVES